jgi:hypothetical protein
VLHDRVVPVEQPCPVHVPLLCQVPAPAQVCVSVPRLQLPHATGFVCPGAQTPTHEAEPALTTHVCPEQLLGVPHAPAVEHVDTPLPMHVVAPGVQTPWQAAVVPFCTHAWLVHGIALPSVPLELQTW